MLFVNSIVASSMDKEMIDILASLAEEPNEAGSQRAALSQSIVLDQGKITNTVISVINGTRAAKLWHGIIIKSLNFSC